MIFIHIPKITLLSVPQKNSLDNMSSALDVHDNRKAMGTSHIACVQYDLTFFKPIHLGKYTPDHCETAVGKHLGHASGSL